MKTTFKPATIVALFLAITLCLSGMPVALRALDPAGTGASSASKAYAADNTLSAGSPAEQADGSQVATTLETQATSKAKPKLAKKERKAFKKAAADFSIELLQRCIADGGANANVTVSPTSVMNALALTANGAAGKTRAQMCDVLGDGMSASRLNKALAWYNSKLSDTDEARLRSANSIWYNNDGTLTIKKKFVNVSKKYYDAEVNPADFSSGQTVNDINAWVAQHTNNMIKRIISSLDPDSALVIANALYFDAQWAAPFVGEATAKQTFTDANGTAQTVDMMHSEESRYIEGYGATGFVKPYAKGYSYVALLPNEGTSVNDFVSSLTGAKFRKLVSKASNARVQVAMPKYTVEYTNDNLKNQLSAMGMESAFLENANFKKMGTSEKGNLYIDSVIHKTKVEVDENGTKAAAATAVVIANATSLVEPQYKYVTLDRPFVYAIVDNTTHLPVFIGSVSTVSA